MKTKAKDRVTLQQLHDHCKLKRNRIHKEFDFSKWNHGIVLNGSPIPNCLTAGCLAGELPALDPDWRFGDEEVSFKLYWNHPTYKNVETIVALAAYFKLSNEEASHIFVPHDQSVYRFGGIFLINNSPIADVLKNLKAFIKYKNNKG